MQAAKDSFLSALRSRLAALDPSRVVIVDGATRPAVVALENESLGAIELEVDTFLITWGASSLVTANESLRSVECVIEYGVRGTEGSLCRDRGRLLTAMDTQLMRICQPRAAAKKDYMQRPAVDLGTKIFWTMPVLGEPKQVNSVLQRRARMIVYFYPETNA